MKAELEAQIASIVQDLFGVELRVDLTRPDEQFGDYATNVALQLSKRLGKNPREVGEQLAAKIAQDYPANIAEATVAGPGFVNLRLTTKALLLASEMDSVVAASGEAVIETNNPNPFKTMHIGHAFNAILADTVANLLDLGGQVHRVSYHGDVGAHVGKSMYSLLRYVDGDPSKLNDIPVNERNAFMLKMYAEGATAYKEDPAAKAQIDQLAEQSFSLDDPVYKQVYETCKSWSFDQIDELVARLGNKPIAKRYLESQADTLGVKTAQAHVPDVFQQSDGALIFKGSDYGSFDNVFVSASGRGLYAARDLGLMQLKNQDYPNAKHSYIVTAEEQRAYFVGVIKAAELCLPKLSGVTVNIPTGTVKLSTGKMSSRSGDVLEIGWLFDQIEQAITARGGEPTTDVVAGALRYQFLKVRIGSDVVFDIDEAVSIQGNSGPYLQYAHARARSVLSKVTAQPASLNQANLTAEERSLLRKISEFTEVRDKAATELLPHLIATYAYELSQAFNHFYEHNRVVGDEREAIRASVVALYANTLKKGLSILGIASPDKM